MNQEEAKKEEKLFNFLTLSIDELNKGSRQKLNQIIDEVCNKQKKPEFLRMWMNCFHKKLIENFQKKQNYKLLVEIVLYKMPWFNDSSNHLSLINLLEKFILALISINLTYAQIIYQFLVERIVPANMQESEKSMKEEIQLQLGGELFSNKGSLLLYIKQMINKYHAENLEEFLEIDEADQKFMINIFQYHPNAKEKLKRMKNIFVGTKQFGLKSSKCFFIQRENEILYDDISYIKCVNGLSNQQYEKKQLEIGSTQLKNQNEQLIQLISRISVTYPLYNKFLVEMLKERFPHKLKNTECHKIYVITLLKIGIKLPQLLPNILSIIIEKLLIIDAEVKIEPEANKIQQIFTQIELAEEINFQNTNQDYDYSREMANKLDWLMLLLFQFIDLFFVEGDQKLTDTIFGNQKDLANLKQAKLQDIFLQIFKQQIIITHQSKHVQFLLFYICSKSNQIADKFLQLIIQNIIHQDKSIYMSSKINYIFYLGSFLARAKFLQNNAIVNSLTSLLQYMSKYVIKNQELESPNETEDLYKQHQILYYIIQSTMYIICFRLHSFEEHRQEFFNQFFEILKNSFSSWVFIHKRIFQEFRKICEFYQQIEIKDFLNSKDQEKKYDFIEMHFPFDPYQLENSEKYIKPFYRQWNQQGFQQRKGSCTILKSCQVLCSTDISEHSKDVTTPINDYEEIQQFNKNPEKSTLLQKRPAHYVSEYDNSQPAIEKKMKIN